MDDVEDNMGSTTTSATELEFSPEQLAAQRLGLNVLEGAMPHQEMQIRRGLSLLQPSVDETSRAAKEAIMGSTRSASGLVRSSLGASLAQAGLPMTSTAPLLERMYDIDPEIANAARNQFIDFYLKGSPIQAFRPDIGRYLIEPNKATQTSETSQGSGAMALQIGGTLIGAGAAVAAAIII